MEGRGGCFLSLFLSYFMLGRGVLFDHLSFKLEDDGLLLSFDCNLHQTTPMIYFISPLTNQMSKRMGYMLAN